MESRDAEAVAQVLEHAARVVRTLGVRGPGRVDTASATADPRPLVLTVREAAEELRVSRSSIYTLIRTGDLPSIQLGSARRIVRSALVDWLDTRSVR